MKRLFLFSVLVVMLAACTSQTAGPEAVEADVKAVDTTVVDTTAVDVTVFRPPT